MSGCRIPVVHELKTVDPYFSLVAAGHKGFEVRRDDRAYAVGDILNLRQYIAKEDAYTGFSVRASVTSLLRGPAFGIEASHVVLGICLENGPSEVTRLRAALSAIAALQAEEPEDTSEETGERFDSKRDAYESGEMDGYRAGQWDAAEMARAALGGGK